MDIELVVFDLAGTTVNDDDGVHRAVQSALAAVGLTVSRDQVNEVMGIPKPQALAHLIQQAGRHDLSPQLDAIHADFVARMIHFYQTDRSVHEIAGAGQVFRLLRSAGIKVALDTGFSRDIVDVLLGRLGWNDSRLVNLSVTSDEVSRGRPHPDMIERAMAALAVTDPRRIAKVGDTPADLQEGTHAGCGVVVGVTSGSHTADQLRLWPHTHLITSVVELPALLGIKD
jgi:phosphonatase-like hydrolase